MLINSISFIKTILVIFLLKVNAILRRANIDKSNKLIVGNLTLDNIEHMAYVDNQELQLTVREFNLLFKLLSYPKKTFSRSALMEEFCDFDSSAPSSEERKEIESIRNSYIEQVSLNNDKISLLRKLDNKVKNTPKIISLSIGIIALLIFGLGFSMILEWQLLLFGIIICAFGIVFMILAYPIYKTSLKILKLKYSSEILKLSEELLNNEDFTKQ